MSGIYVVRNNSTTNRCEGCLDFIPEGEYVAYDPKASHGRELRHIKCIDVPRDVVAARQAMLRATEASDQHKRAKAEREMRKAEREVAAATREVLEWALNYLLANQKRRDKLRRRLDETEEAEKGFFHPDLHRQDDKRHQRHMRPQQRRQRNRRKPR